ncbi:MAG: TetR/AcrR family transcriptional regulator [Spirochaetales bacterium]|nr:TetR/AcrR family transcriptional regulator [Spirochaetales bacterium]
MKNRELSERQLEILDNTLSIIAENGIQEFSIRNLAHKIGISEPAIYRHFENKEDILLSLVFYMGQNVEASLSKMNIPADSSFEQLEYITNGAVDFFEKNRSITTVFFSHGIFQYNEKLVQEMKSLYELGISVYSTMIRKAQKENNMRKDIVPERASEIITGALHGLITRWILSNYEFSLCSEWRGLWTTLKSVIT